MDRRIFKEYDIRGVVGRDFGRDDAYLIGRGFGTWLVEHGDRVIVLGHDARLHSPGLYESFAEGVLASGIDAIRIGCQHSPAAYFAIRELGADGSAVVTASHNPPEYNGFKLRRRSPVFGAEIQEIRRIVEDRRFAEGAGSARDATIRGRYLEEVGRRVKLSRPLHVVLDAGNGTAGPVARSLFEGLGCRVEALFCDPDGRFPHHHPDPLIPANLRHLQERVRETGADAGFAYDGDGDRLAIVDETGAIHHADRILTLLARRALGHRPGAAVVFDVKCSIVLEEEIRRLGGRPVMVKTGYPFLLAAMASENAALGGELSGHMYFDDPVFRFDDGVYASARVAEAIADLPGALSGFFDSLPRTCSSPEIRCRVPEDRKFAVAAALAEEFRRIRGVIDLDGARVLYPDGWGLVRASNTEPSLVLVFEGRTPAALGRIMADFRDALGRHPEVELSF